MDNSIILLHNDEIDLEKWDRRVRDAVNSRVYAESWYLDIVGPDWMGLIYNDYEYVMPVIGATKAGIKYAFQPAFSQQHGIFPPATPEITQKFIIRLKQEYKYFGISLNTLNVSVNKQVETEPRKNFILSLKHNYESIQGNYSTHAARYVRKAKKACGISHHVNLDEYIELKERFAQKSFSTTHRRMLKLILLKSFERGKGVVYGAYTPQNELCAAAFFMKEHKRYTYLNSVSSPVGKDLRAMYAILDKFLFDHAGTPYLLDFEGSNIEGIARFFIGFGAEAETYQHIKYNNLPWYIKIFKR